MKICFISGSRADYGLLSNLMKFFKNDKKYNLQIIVTGSHLSKMHGLTYNEIEKDKFKITKKIKLNIDKKKSENISEPISIGIKQFSISYKNLKPDLIVLLGDRYEIFSACCAANISQIPICHLHGGELTRGSIDDTFRHSMTKMSQFHFVAHKKYSKRVRQLGEDPKKIYVVGGFGVDLIKRVKLLSKKNLEKKLNIQFGKKNILVTYHPETTNGSENKKDFKELLKALKTLKQTKIIFTRANADKEGRLINSMIDKFVKKNKNISYVFSSMGYKNYLSTLKFIDVCLGNSSSGLLEVPTFKKITINIGDRQKDRIKAPSVFDVRPKANLIIKTIKEIDKKKFKDLLKKTVNPYGGGGASKKTYQIIKKLNLENSLSNKFFDLDYEKKN
jgi:GDP/UDP-N,N'-diacetylbacillosamine 2-epimerase (hydrolysing)